MRFKWDNSKNKLLKNDRQRGLDFEEVKEIFNYPYYLDQKNDDPEQYRAVGFVQGRMITLIYEVREDDEGEYFHFVTYWPSTKTEREIYEKE